MQLIRYIYVLFFIFGTISINAKNEININKIREKKLKEYSFKRSLNNFNDVELLLGNGEMGSTAKQNGLGFERLWFSDFWRTSAARMPIYGPCFEFEASVKPDSYSQELDLYSGVLYTTYKEKDISYKSEIFFSDADKDLLIIKLYDISESAKRKLKLKVPVWDVSATEGDRSEVIKSKSDYVFSLTDLSSNCVIGTSIDDVMRDCKLMYKSHEQYDVTNKMVYGVNSSAKLIRTSDFGTYSVDLEGKNEMLLVFTESTNWANGDLKENTLNQLRNKVDFDLLKRAHVLARKDNWEKLAVIELPDVRHEQLWYRSLFWLFASTVSKNCLPGESQFGFEGWNMLPFTYGTAGWGALDYAMLGDPEKSLHILKQFDLPEAQHRNALHWLEHAQQERISTGMTHEPPYKQDPKSPYARCFAHEMQTTGDCTLLTWGNQGHLQGFCVELFQRHYNYYPSEQFLCTYLYPVAKGIAEYWSNFLIWNHNTKEYYTAKTWGASEAGMHNNPLDAVMAAKKTLKAAAKYAKQLGVDKDLVEKWEFIDKNLHYPRNESGYVAYSGHDGFIPEDGSGYNGIRYMNAANFINQEIVCELESKCVVNTLDKISKSNKFGTGFAVFHSAQTATAEALYGRGESAIGYLNNFLKALDSSGTTIRECEDRHMTYFHTNTDAFLLSHIFLLMQSSNGVIKPFPAVPSSWKNVTFYNLPAENEIKVSGKMENGKVKWVNYYKNGELLKQSKSNESVRIKDIIK